MNVFLQSILLAGIGVCVWLAFHPSSREAYDDIENPRKPPRPTVVLSAGEIPPEPRSPRRGEGRLVGPNQGEHDEVRDSAGRATNADERSR